jgi:hypothetical protein
LFFNSIKDLDIAANAKATKYNVIYNTPPPKSNHTTDIGQRAVVVQFYHSHPSSFYAEVCPPFFSLYDPRFTDPHPFD